MSYFKYQSKKIYYTETGSGEPLLFLHGNTASSRMFELLLPLYQDRFYVILIDFLGHGKSDRLECFPADLWKEEARQTVALMEHLKLGKIHLVGTSGGAWVALNVALKRPDLVGKVVADSFDGRTLAEDFAEKLIKERAGAKMDEMGVGFYQWCQGEDWESVVDMDTKAMVSCAEGGLPLFIKPLEQLSVPLLLMGSEEDDMCRADFLDEYQMIAEETDAQMKIFPKGKHPAILSNAEQAAEAIIRFLE
ncbi:MAG: alpha/beta hydrolase [Faecalicatena sp.]|uniref:alpha/beta fold hydrolase n=1 Tax=Faecalicatena sp. TaxID=2005360 RepID=UPI00258565FB|nr:alpha/beta hydrolase [Faecalicatena sp.]MCI6466769.1 alpha/beta hydrolase [Faecalicatena sp.]MDY5620562.1 alpha/beta hydrolase [Lachnospiraceae bacterium]